MFSETVFLSYATEAFEEKAMAMLKTALNVGFDTIRLMRPRNLVATQFWKENQDILELPRGAGYWLWKPYIILETVRNLPKGGVLVYSDGGREQRSDREPREFYRMPLLTLRLAAESPKGYIPGWLQHWFSQGMYTKRDLFVTMNMDTPEMHQAGQVGATWSVWTRTDEAIYFLEEWLKYACNAQNITDSDNILGLENLPDFKEHRHDQSILSLLAYREKAHYLYFTSDILHDIIRKRIYMPPGEWSPKSLIKIDETLHAFIRNVNPIYANSVYTPFCKNFVANIDLDKVRPPFRTF